MKTGYAENKFWDLVELDQKDSEDGVSFDAKCIVAAYGKSFEPLVATPAYKDSHAWYTFLTSIGLDFGWCFCQYGKVGWSASLVEKIATLIDCYPQRCP